MRFLGIDYGTKRVGVAIGDMENRLALPLRTLKEEKQVEVISALCRLIKEEDVAGVVLGEPTTLAGERGQAAENVRAFGAALENACAPIPVFFVDERFSSALADRETPITGGDRDATAAAAILQTYLDMQRPVL
ncbi:Holliday junction resolvase RuvX [Patescibacteria group bacterium]|nr:Holliday junction resolvase RuvX [Patescibacteria group bacterium]